MRKIKIKIKYSEIQRHCRPRKTERQDLERFPKSSLKARRICSRVQEWRWTLTFSKAFCVEIAQAFRCPKQKGLEKENPAMWCHIFSGVSWLPSGQLPQWLKTQSFCISSFLVWEWFVNCNKWRHPWSSLVRALLEDMGGALGAGWKTEQLITAPFFSEKHRRENTHRVDTLQ